MEGGDIKHKMLLLIKYEVVMKKKQGFWRLPKLSPKCEYQVASRTLRGRNPH